MHTIYNKTNLIKQKNGEYRICIDDRELNSLTVRAKRPLLSTDYLIDGLHCSYYFTSLDLNQGYYFNLLRMNLIKSLSN